MRNLDENYLYEKLLEFLEKYDKEFLENLKKFDENYNKKIFKELKTRIRYFAEYKDFTSLFYNEPKLLWKDIFVNSKMKIESIEDVKKALNFSLEILNSIGNFEDFENIKNIFIEKIKESGLKNWQVLWPLRCALSGEEFSPWALELIYILWKEESEKRIQKNLTNLT